VLGVLALGPAVALAGVGVGAGPNIPSPNGPLAVGQTGVASSMTITNGSDGAQASQNVTLSAITIVPSCGTLASVDCPVASFDPDVFALSSTATGAAGTACAAKTFTVTNVDGAQDKYEFIPSAPATPVVLGPASAGGPLATCRINFTVSVLKQPTLDTRPDAGVQTNVLASAIGTADDLQVAQGAGSNGVTISRANPTITTQTSQAAIALGGQFSDAAVISGRVAATAGATITFTLYGPGDPNCIGAPVFTSTRPQPTAEGAVVSGVFTPVAVGSYRWIASYSGDANNNPVTGICNEPGETTVVVRATPSIATAASPPSLALGQTVTDTATVTGRVNPGPGSTVSFSVYGPGDVTCSGPPLASYTVAYPVTGSATSPAYTPTQTGTHRWRATYSGDANNDSVAGACNAVDESFTVSKATPALTTTASANIVVGGGSLTDSATVSARQFPLAGASLDFRLYGPSDAACTGSPAFQALGVGYPVAGGAVASPPFTPTQPGTYRWVASYSGDANNNAVTGACNDADESTVVAIAAPAIASSASPGIVLGSGTLTDTATVSGRVNSLPGATVEFRLYGPADATCSGTPVFTSAPVPYPVAGGSVSSPAFTPTQAGTYRWRAFYSGDANNLAAAGACDAPNASAVVARATPTITTTASSGIALGSGALRDSATVGGRASPVAGASVQFRLYADPNVACGGPPVFTGEAPVDDAGNATSPGFTPTAAGAYRWVASYGGDSNNAPVSSDCSDPKQSVTVAPAALVASEKPLILSAGFGGVRPRVGRTVTLTVRARGRGESVIGLRVQFGETRGQVGTSTCRPQPAAGSATAAVSQRVPYAFRTPGSHRVKVVVLAGSCSGPLLTSTTKTIMVNVARGAPKPKSPATTRFGCRYATVVSAPGGLRRVRMASAVLCLVNYQRRKYGRAKLRRSALLARIAGAHSTDMVRRRFWDHNTRGGRTFEQRLPRAGYKGTVRGENLDYNSENTALLAVQAWMNSPPHRSTLLHRRLKFAGVGIANGIPVDPKLPGATVAMDYGSTLR